MSTKVEPADDQFRVVINDGRYNSGADIAITQYADEEAALAGALWWDERLAQAAPDELIDMDSAERFPRVDA